MIEDMKMTKDFTELARKREEEAANLSDMDIWRSVVSKVVMLDMDLQTRVDILLQSIPDLGVTFGLLKAYNNDGTITDKEYHDLLEECIRRLENDKRMVDFDPREYTE